MTREAGHDRTVRLLAGRLEAIATARERLAADAVALAGLELDVRRALAATRNAVSLELLSPAEAGAIWEEASRRHPQARLLVDWQTAAA